MDQQYLHLPGEAKVVKNISQPYGCITFLLRKHPLFLGSDGNHLLLK